MIQRIRRINLFGGPGCGKSTVAARVYSYLKTTGHNIELVREYIKTWVYLNRKPVSFDQLFTTANQIHQEDLLLQNGVDLIVTDSPILVSVFYTQLYSDYGEELLSIARKMDEKYPAMNIFIDRGNRPYKTTGRWGSAGESKEIDKNMKACLKEWNIPYVIKPHNSPIERFVSDTLTEENRMQLLAGEFV